MLDASVMPWFIETESEDVLGNEFDFGLSLPVSVPSGPVAWRALRAVLRCCCDIVASLPFRCVGFALLLPRSFPMPISLSVLTLLWFCNLWGRFIHEVYPRGCKGGQQQVSLCVCRDPRCCFRHASRPCFCLALREAVVFSLLVPRRLLRCEPLRSSSCSSSVSCTSLLVCTASAVRVS